MKFVEQVLSRFEKKKPVAVMARMLIANAISARSLDGIFAQNCVRQVPGELRFSLVAELMGEVVLQIQPSINSAYGEREIGVSVKAVYDKLQGIETNVSRAVVQQTAKRFKAILAKMGGTVDPLQPGYRTRIVDGNHLRHSDARIGALRDQNVAPLPGKSLVVYDGEYGLAIDVLPCECGHASERTLLPLLLETVERRDLWIADRNFSTVGFLVGLSKRGAKYIVRQHGQMAFSLKGRRRRIGTTDSGVVYEQSMEIVDEGGEVHTVRRVTVELYEPTRDGHTELHVVSNLPKRVSAIRIANLYRKRWTIETAFQKMAENLEGEIRTLGYPKAALFGFCMALVSYNLFSVIQATVRSVHGKEVANHLSFYYMSNEISSSHEGMSVVLDNDFWQQEYGMASVSRIASELQRIVKEMNQRKYRKNKWTPKKKPKPKKDKTNRQHASTYKLLQAARQRVAK